MSRRMHSWRTMEAARQATARAMDLTGAARRRRLLEDLAAIAPQPQGDSTELIREDRDRSSGATES